MWQVVHRMNYYLANIQRIEAGTQHPKLAREYAADLPQSLSGMSRVVGEYAIPILQEGQKSFFGSFLAQARLAGAVSQIAMAKAAKYSLRNINIVESDRQEPGIMTALALVITSGVDVEEFFNILYACWRERHAPAQSAG